MDGVDVRWDEEVVKWLALLGVLAFVGMAMAPLATGDTWGLIGIYVLDDMPKGAQVGWLICDIMTSTMYGAAIGAAFGTVPGLIAGAAIGF